MPIQKRWTRFTLANVKKLPNKPGAYELASRNKSIIDTGGSNTSVRDRLMSHLRDNRYPTACYFRCDFVGWLDLVTGIEKEAKHSEKFQKEHGKKPKYTQRSPKKHSWWPF